MTMYVKDYYKNEDVTKVVLSLSDVKAGLDDTKTKTVTMTDQQEIQDIIDALHQRTIVRTYPDFWPVNPNPNDRLELRITLTSTEKVLLEYLITSKGHVEIRKGSDDFSNVFVLNGSATKWFEDLKKLFNAKNQTL
jgi:hypothetical protein